MPSDEPMIDNVTIEAEALTLALQDGRTISAPLAWFPRLAAASPDQRQKFRLSAAGSGVHWPDLDEDISASGLLARS